MTTRPTPDYASGVWAHIFAPRAKGEVRYWLVKSEPDVFSWEQLNARADRTTHWDGVRNYSARNFMLDGMALGDRVFYYHSNANPQAIVGIAEVAKLAYPDHTQFEKGNDYYDGDATPDAPTWWMVNVRAVETLARPVTLAEIKATPALANMALLKVGRLSVVPVTPAEWAAVLDLAKTPVPVATKQVVKKVVKKIAKQVARKKTSTKTK